MAATPSVFDRLMTAVYEVRQATAQLTLESKTPEAQVAMDILQKLEGLCKMPVIIVQLTQLEQDVALCNEVIPEYNRGKIPAIRLYRERTGADLKDAKNVVENFLRSKGR